MNVESRNPLKIVTSDATEAEMELALQKHAEAERERLGIQAARRQWTDGMTKSVMTRKEREEVTLLMGGLTAAQDFLLEGALKGLGYKVRHLRTPDNEGLTAGKEFGNRGQCNPTYYTVGTLVSELQRARDAGMTPEEVVKKHVFLTAGACGPCRFGMYVTEYRKALRDAGFDGFRVMLFQQQGGLKQATGDDLGLELNPRFFRAIVKAIVAGDVLNALGYRIRPYEVEEGATNRALEECKRILYRRLYEQKSVLVGLWKCRKILAGVKVDKLRAKPKVSIIGEFWAMTTEGDGNYHLQKFLESEGAENDIQFTTAWLLYNVWEWKRDTLVRRDLRGADSGRKGLERLGTFGIGKRLFLMYVAEKVLRVLFKTFAWPAGLHGYKLSDMEQVADAAANYYSHDLRGGEGHMEVGKLIVNVVHSKAHMTLSVKPFGCMPSSGVSDGVQSLVQARFPGTIYCAVETSGDGATNFYSRVQMFLFKARLAAEAELEKAFRDSGVTRDAMAAWIARHPRVASSLWHAPHHEGTAGSAANLVYQVAPLMKTPLPVRIGLGAWNRARAAGNVALAGVVLAARGVAMVFSRETWAKLRNDVNALRGV